jgi:uncharacterized protein
MSDRSARTLFVVFMLDKGGMAERRAMLRPDHIAFMKSLGSAALLGGPLLDADGETRNGGLYILEAGSLAEAREIAGQDPFVQAGLFEMASVRQWVWQTDNVT